MKERKLIYIEPSGERRYLGGVREAAQKLGVSVASVYRNKNVVEIPDIWVVRSEKKMVCCYRDSRGAFREIGTDIFVRATGAAKNVTRALYDMPEIPTAKIDELTRGKRIEGGYVWADGTVVGKTGKPLKVQKDGSVLVAGKRKKVDRIVAEAFLPEVPDAVRVEHRDGDKRNNAAGNLKWSVLPEKHKGAMPVSRSTPSGKNMKVFRSVREAAKDRGVSVQMIYQFIWGRKRDCQDYIWSYWYESD